MTDYLLQLHDDALINMGEYAGKIYGPETYARLGLTCKRMLTLLLPSSAQTIQNIILSRIAYYVAKRSMPIEATLDLNIKSLKELAVFEAWCQTPLHVDNRIPFPYASVDVNESMHEKIHYIMKIMQRYPSLTVYLDSHCGTIAPNSVASSFSRIRGDSIRDILYDPSRVHVIGWGKRIASRVAQSDNHPFGELAREGRGWVEVSFVLRNDDDRRTIVLPPRHKFYNPSNATAAAADDDDDNNAVRVNDDVTVL
mmetsp:Transcript_11721/g.17963  ORF Transcript_11721/g.17963 Transcript_11721/m.17963 type:complete len:254 (-) Transcript_11721:1308-2069(-)